MLGVKRDVGLTLSLPTLLRGLSSSARSSYKHQRTGDRNERMRCQGVDMGLRHKYLVQDVGSEVGRVLPVPLHHPLSCEKPKRPLRARFPSLS